MNEQDKQSLIQMQDILKRVQDVRNELSELNNEIHNLRLTSFVGEAIPFPNKQNENNFNDSMMEIDKLLDLKTIINDQLEAKEKTFEVGDAVVSNDLARYIKDPLSYCTYRVDTDGKIEKFKFKPGGEFEVIDFDGQNYTLLHHGYIVTATPTQMSLFFSKTDHNSKVEYFKVELSLNGFKNTYSKEIKEVKLFTTKRCYDRVGGDWTFDYNDNHRSIGVKLLSSDELFGINIVAYFRGKPSQFTQSISPTIINDITVLAGERYGEKDDQRFIMGFTKKEGEVLRYNGKISIFDRKHMPKEVFTSPIQGRLAHVFAIQQIKEAEKAEV